MCHCDPLEESKKKMCIYALHFVYPLSSINMLNCLLVSQICDRLLIRESRKLFIRMTRKIVVLWLTLEDWVGFRSEIKAPIFRCLHVRISLWVSWLSSHRSQWKLRHLILERYPFYTRVDIHVGLRSPTELSKGFGDAPLVSQLPVAGNAGRRTNGYKMTTNTFNPEINRKFLIIRAVMFPQHSHQTSAKCFQID